MDFIGTADFSTVATVVGTAIAATTAALVAIAVLTVPLGAGKRFLGFVMKKISFR